MGVISAQCRSDREIDTFAIAKHLIVPESDHPITLSFHARRTRSVRLGFVLPAIDFYDQLRPMAGEVRDEVADWNLTAEVEARKLFAQQPPHGLLGVSHVATEPASPWNRT